LRTRITEAIRVLEDFSSLAEDGRSRAEYTNQLLKDVCACTSSDIRASVPKAGCIDADIGFQITATMSSWQRSSCAFPNFHFSLLGVEALPRIQITWCAKPISNLSQEPLPAEGGICLF
jgi:hypothetical protein